MSTVTFTSPHLLHISERWRVDGKPVRPEVLAGAWQRATIAMGETNLTYFERAFVLAVALCPGRTFICEVGLGGRLDCANALDAGAAAIAQISLDHVHILGETVLEIAAEKIAIHRSDAPLFIAPQTHIDPLKIAALVPKATPSNTQHPTLASLV